MKLTKAIEILDLNLKEAGSKMPPDCRDAVQLSIEALKHLQHERDLRIGFWTDPIPGETPEG